MSGFCFGYAVGDHWINHLEVILGDSRHIHVVYDHINLNFAFRILQLHDINIMIIFVCLFIVEHWQWQSHIIKSVLKLVNHWRMIKQPQLLRKVHDLKGLTMKGLSYQNNHVSSYNYLGQRLYNLLNGHSMYSVTAFRRISIKVILETVYSVTLTLNNRTLSWNMI